jgi:hypothetical protein
LKTGQAQAYRRGMSRLSTTIPAVPPSGISMSSVDLPTAAAGRSRILAALAGSFLGMVTVDFLLHAVLLSAWWRSTEPYWRPPAELFALIPFAYASFALYAAGLLWLLTRIFGRRLPVASAALYGVGTGTFIGVTSALAIYSAVSLPRSALLVFPISFAAVFAGGAVSAALILRAVRPWRRLAILTGAFILLFVSGVVLQNLFLPTSRSHRRPSPITQAPAGLRGEVNSALGHSQSYPVKFNYELV